MTGGSKAGAAKAFLVVSGLALAGWAAGPAAATAAPFVLTSPDYADGALMPQKSAASVRDCGGQNLSPPLRWSNAPAGTASFAIMMIDIDGGKGFGFVHWLAYGIPVDKTVLREGEASAPAADIVGGHNMPGTGLYFGPCPPPGQAPHHYIISLLALDLSPQALKPGLDHAALVAALKGHSLAATSLVGRYGR